MVESVRVGEERRGAGLFIANSAVTLKGFTVAGLRLSGVIGPSSAPREFLVVQWQGGAQELVWPSEVISAEGAPPEELVKTAELLWPKPRQSEVLPDLGGEAWRLFVHPCKPLVHLL